MTRAALLAALFALAACAPAEAPTPVLPGEAAAAPAPGSFTDTPHVAAPDGKSFVFIRTLKAGGATSLWIALPGGIQRRLTAEKPNPGQPHLNLVSLSRPVFAPDGASILFNAKSWPASDSLQRYNLSTGQIRYVTDGTLLAVVSGGSLQGDLILARHRYSPAGGVFTPAQLTSPSGRVIERIPNGERRSVLANWAAAKGAALSLPSSAD
ncbi:MAG: hypothetical protein U1E50_02015 [Caulobacteraceae bacterium]